MRILAAAILALTLGCVPQIPYPRDLPPIHDLHRALFDVYFPADTLPVEHAAALGEQVSEAIWSSVQSDGPFFDLLREIRDVDPSPP